MLSKNSVRFIISLQKKKERDKEKLFVIEGDKIVREYINAGMPVRTLVAKREFLSTLPQDFHSAISDIEIVTYEELKKVSSLIAPHNALAIIQMPEIEMDPAELKKGLSVALDSVQDPGNLGTIVRAAAWFGIKNIYCNEDCVDVFNPKVIQATMGAILHVNVFYTNLCTLLESSAEYKIPVYGTVLEGKSIYEHELGKKGVILLGNESKGISDCLLPYVTEKIMIPRFNKALYGIDSLNVGMAASVILSEFARRK
jgi:TrmH family RNA methyltransferase